MKPKFKRYFMGIAELTGQLSHARRLKVGAVVVKDDRVISIGYNGMPAGWDNNCEQDVFQQDGTMGLKTRPEVLHAEMNCLMKVAQSTESSTDSVMFTTHAPCMDCAKAIFQSGIRQIFYREPYRDDSGIQFLKTSGVGVEQYNANQDND